MNIRKLTLNCLICIAMAASATAGELPAAYSPFKKILGEWAGTAELEVHTEKGVEKLKSEKTSKCEFDEKRGSIVMSDSATNPWTHEKADSNAEVRWDESSKCFKAIMWGNGSGAQLYLIEQKGDTLHFRRIDAPPEDRFESVVSIDTNGKLIEKGKITVNTPSKATIEWTTVFEKAEKQSD